MMDGWFSMTAAALGRGMESGAIDPRDVTEAFLAAIATHPQADRVFARTTPERARAEAADAAGRARAGVRRGPLDGVPLAWKDLFDSAGVATEAGAALLAGRIPVQDAAVLSRATRAGLVCLGKTHMTELAFSGLGVNPVTATPPNAHDAGLAPGGSSSGSGVAVALGLAPAAIGSDTGGSVRVPAAWNGLVGFKTSPGSLPMAGVVPLCPSFDTIGPLVRSVEDAALILSVLGTPAVDLTGATVRGMRFRVADGSVGQTRAAPAAAFEAAVARLEAAGAVIVRGPTPALAEALGLAGILFGGEAYGMWREVIEAHPDLMYPLVRERFRSGASVSAADFVGAWRRLEDLRAAWGAWVADCDAMLMPTTPNLPPPVDRLLADADFFATENLMALRNTRLINLMGGCAVTLPVAEAAGRRDCGLMAAAPGGRDAALLRVAAGMERALA